MSRKGPFGLAMGMAIDEVGIEFKEVAPSKYLLPTVPKPHSAFEQYVVQAPPICGLSWIKAIGRTIQTSSHGIDLKDAFNEMEKKLSVTYGVGKKNDFLLPGSVWDEPRDWMQGLMNHERILATFWSLETQHCLPDSLSSIALVAAAVDSGSGYIAIEYSFENAPSADAEIAAAEDDAL